MAADFAVACTHPAAAQQALMLIRIHILLNTLPNQVG
jgi:hypothetical protein